MFRIKYIFCLGTKVCVDITFFTPSMAGGLKKQTKTSEFEDRKDLLEYATLCSVSAGLCSASVQLGGHQASLKLAVWGASPSHFLKAS